MLSENAVETGTRAAPSQVITMTRLFATVTHFHKEVRQKQSQPLMPRRHAKYPGGGVQPQRSTKEKGYVV
jgi:hypothetical protein